MNDVLPSVTNYEKELDALSRRFYNKGFTELCTRRKKVIERIFWNKKNRERKK